MNRMEHLLMTSVIVETLQMFGLNDSARFARSALERVDPGKISLLACIFPGNPVVKNMALDEIFKSLHSNGCLPTVLDLRYNLLADLPGSVGLLGSLTYIDLSSNRLSDLPSELFNISALSALNVSANRLKYIPSAIENLVNLEYLYANDNELTSIPSGLERLSKLYALDLGLNRLESVPEFVNRLPNLHRLEAWTFKCD